MRSARYAVGLKFVDPVQGADRRLGALAAADGLEVGQRALLGAGQRRRRRAAVGHGTRSRGAGGVAGRRVGRRWDVAATNLPADLCLAAGQRALVGLCGRWQQPPAAEQGRRRQEYGSGDGLAWGSHKEAGATHQLSWRSEREEASAKARRNESLTQPIFSAGTFSGHGSPKRLRVAFGARNWSARRTSARNLGDSLQTPAVITTGISLHITVALGKVVTNITVELREVSKNTIVNLGKIPGNITVNTCKAFEYITVILSYCFQMLLLRSWSWTANT